MENGNGDSKAAVATKKMSRQETLRAQTIYLRASLDAAEQALRSAQRIAYQMFSDGQGGQQNGEMPSFLGEIKRRRRPRSPEAIKRAVATRAANKEANEKRIESLKRQVERMSRGKSKSTKPKAAKTEDAPIEKEPVTAAA